MSSQYFYVIGIYPAVQNRYTIKGHIKSVHFIVTSVLEFSFSPFLLWAFRIIFVLIPYNIKFHVIYVIVLIKHTKHNYDLTFKNDFYI